MTSCFEAHSGVWLPKPKQNGTENDSCLFVACVEMYATGSELATLGYTGGQEVFVVQILVVATNTQSALLSAFQHK